MAALVDQVSRECLCGPRGPQISPAVGDRAGGSGLLALSLAVHTCPSLSLCTQDEEEAVASDQCCEGCEKSRVLSDLSCQT